MKAGITTNVADRIRMDLTGMWQGVRKEPGWKAGELGVSGDT